MSLHTWKLEFYPKPPSKKMTAIEAVKHSLKKWEGLTDRNIKKHDLTRVDGGIAGDQWEHIFSATATNCALCVKYYEYESEDSCKRCPLAIVRKGVACDLASDILEEEESPFRVFLTRDNPRQMIMWLKKALKFVEKENKK